MEKSTSNSGTASGTALPEALEITEALEDRERLHYALTASEEGIWDWNLKSDTGYLSPRYFEMLGYAVNEFSGTGKVWEAMIHPNDRTETVRALIDLIQNKKNVYNAVYRLRAKNGTYRWIRSRAIVVRYDDQGVPQRLVGTHMDITEDREKDQALIRYKDNLELEVEARTRELKATNRKLETILNASSESIWVCDGQGLILSLNKAAEKMLNVRARELIGQHIGILETQWKIDRSVTLEVLKTRQAVTAIQRVSKPKRQLLVTGTPVFGDDGEIEMVIANERDLTHLNQLQDDLQAAQKASSRYMEELTSLNLHELKEQSIIAESKEMQQVIATAVKLSRRKISPILVLGESGTGKGLIAKFIHSRTYDNDKPFVQLNCAALPETLLEAELFGYEKGAFTGAKDKGKIGLFEMAKGGTLFLDELGEMSLPVQAKLLKCLEEREIMPLGGLKPIKIDCSIIAATNANLKKQIQEKKFRQDLFFRINTFTITLPPLRKRPEDIFEMIIFFMKKYTTRYGVNRKLSSTCIKKIQSYSFPGNIRELKNLLKKAVVMGESDILEDLDPEPHPPPTRQAPPISAASSSTEPMETPTPPALFEGKAFKFNKKMLTYEKELIRQALEHHDTTRSLAKCLELSQSSVVRKLKIHGLSHHLKRNAQRQ